eukprot:8924617-Pyramimonas_sp.AAC.1
MCWRYCAILRRQRPFVAPQVARSVVEAHGPIPFAPFAADPSAKNTQSAIGCAIWWEPISQE